MMPVIFITDGFIFLLVLMVSGYIFYARRHEHLSAPWRAVACRPLAMSAAIILILYIVIGLLDSFHFHAKLEATESSGEVYSTEVSSILDLMLEDLRNNTERTYSAPLATYAFSKEMLDLADGKQVRDYPRLKYGGAHLTDPESERIADIGKHVVVGLVCGLMISLLLSSLLVLFLAKGHELSFKQAALKLCRN